VKVIDPPNVGEAGVEAIEIEGVALDTTTELSPVAALVGSVVGRDE